MSSRLTSFLSFDVEALPGRATHSMVDELIWGRLDGGEYGISRICQVLEQHDLKGNFLLDFAGCLLHGDKAVADVAEFLIGRGHEVHAHLHSEWVVRHWNLHGHKGHLMGLDRALPEVSQALLDFTAHKCLSILGWVPSVFRAGGFMFNTATIQAAKRAGFKVLSNYNYSRQGEAWNAPVGARSNEPFLWDNGLLELPVDFSPEPLSFEWQIYENWLGRVRDRKSEKTNNLVMHSWSLLEREDEKFTRFSPSHEERLHKICERVKQDGDVLTYDQYLRVRDARQTPAACVSSSMCEGAVLAVGENQRYCNICGTPFPEVASNDVCPGCTSRARHRQVQDVMQRAGNPLDGKTVLATFANLPERQAFLNGVSRLLNFDVRPVDEIDVQMDVQDMHLVEDGQYDAFFSIHVLNHVKDDARALAEIYRVLKPGGLAFITLPYRVDYTTTELDDVTVHYGADALQKYGVGSYRRYGLLDAARMFAKYFDMHLESGVDPVSREQMYAFFLTKPFVASASEASG